MSNLGRWERWNSGEGFAAYSDSATYDLGAEFLRSCSLVEDWGCGRCWFQPLIERYGRRYCGIDGSPPRVPSIRTADLVSYRSQVPGIFMRHVLEHNYDWRAILRNAVESFTERMVLVLFTPMVEKTRTIGINLEIGVPDISFSAADIRGRFRPADQVSATELQTATQYGRETIFYVSRGAA